MPAPVCVQIEEVLRTRTRYNPIHGPSIVSLIPELGSDVSLRQYINAMRSSGACICSCSDGYYWSEDPSDLYETIQSLEGRVAGIVKAYTGMRKAAERLTRKTHVEEQKPPRLTTIPLF